MELYGNQKVQLKEVLFLELKNIKKKKIKIILSIVAPFESIQSPSGSVLTVFASNSLSKKNLSSGHQKSS